MKSAGKARSNGLYRHIRTSKEIIRNLLNDFIKYINPSTILKIELIVYSFCSPFCKFHAIAIDIPNI